VRVLVDSNLIIRRDWLLTGPALKELLRASERGHIDLIMPGIVFDEIANKYREVLREAQRNIKRVVRELQLMGAPNPPDALGDRYIDETSSAYETALREKLTRYRARVGPYPAASHELIARRALDRRKPFDAQGHNGYRDALVWSSVLEVAADGPVAFLSGTGVISLRVRKDRTN
jgi:hypothetical protein